MPATKKIKTDALLRKSLLINVILAVSVAILSITLAYVSSNNVHAAKFQSTTILPNTSAGTKAQNTTGPNFLNIDQQFNATELAAINGEPLSNYEVAGEKLLNGTLNNQVESPLVQGYNSAFTPVNTLILAGKPAVIYIGAISCIFCGENRWAMALALGALGNFSMLYKGYSSASDGDVPTIYWNYNNYTTGSGVTFGNFYNSKYLTFVSAEYDSPISGGFQFASTGIQYFVQRAPNATYLGAMQFMNSTGKFQGTPFTYWGNSLVAGADGVVFGNSTPTGSTLDLAKETHAQVLNQFRSFNDQFAWSEYAAADIYLANVCPSLNTTAPACGLPIIKELELLAARTHA